MFKSVDDEKRILVGALLIPDKKIYRRDGNKEYYVYFPKDTIRKAMELYAQRGYQNNATYEHKEDVNGLTLVESWIVDDTKNDKSNIYGLDLPLGTWVGTIKVNNEVIWNDYVKTGQVKGFSIEGYFVDKVKTEEEVSEDLSAEIEAGLKLLSVKSALLKTIVRKKKDARLKTGERLEFESYTDYPTAVSNNAKRGIELNEKNGNKCATQVGKVRAQQLANKEPISLETIKRMYSYLSRAEEYYDENDTKACGTISYLLWGGLAGKRWAESKLKELKQFSKIEFSKISFDFDGVLSTSKGTDLAKKLLEDGNDIYIISARHSKEDLIKKAKEIGILESRVYATGSNEAKVSKINDLKIDTHYDNNQNVISKLDNIGKLYTNEK